MVPLRLVGWSGPLLCLGSLLAAEAGPPAPSPARAPRTGLAAAEAAALRGDPAGVVALLKAGPGADLPPAERARWRLALAEAVVLAEAIERIRAERSAPAGEAHRPRPLSAGTRERASAALEELIADPEAPVELQAVGRLRLVRLLTLAGSGSRAQAAALDLAADVTMPSTVRWVASRLARLQIRGEFQSGPTAGADQIRVVPGAPWDGDPHVVPTLEAARELVRTLRARSPVDWRGAEVCIEGEVPVARTFDLTAEDGGTSAAPVVWRGLPGMRLMAGVRAERFTAPDPDLAARLPAVATGKVRQVDLTALGCERLLPAPAGGFAGGGGSAAPALRLRWNGRPLPLSRWPASGWTTIAAISDQQVEKTWAGAASRVGEFVPADPAIARFAGEPSAVLDGYWCWDWADARIIPASLGRELVRIADPQPQYGYRAGQRFAVVNAIAAIDRPGTWAVDGVGGRLLLWPPGDPARAVVELTRLAGPVIRLSGVSDLRLQDLRIAGAAGDGVAVQGGARVELAGLVISGTGRSAVVVEGGTGHLVRDGQLQDLGRTGVELSGGQRATLTEAGHRVAGMRIERTGQIDRTYTPAVHASGCGLTVVGNTFRDLPSSAVRMDGNLITIERNRFERVVQESDDQGAIDTWGDPTFRGNVIWGNVFSDITGGTLIGAAGVRLDDAISGTLIVANRFTGVGGGIFGAMQIHGGKDNLLLDNQVIDGAAAVSFGPWGQERWSTYLARPDVVGWLQAVHHDQPPFAERWPELRSLAAQADHNLIWGLVLGGSATTSAVVPAANTTGGTSGLPADPTQAEVYAEVLRRGWALAIPPPAGPVGAAELP